MPWQETPPMLERHHFAHDLDSGQWTMTELCTRYGISRNTGYKWAVRYRAHGVAGLHDQSRAPRSSTHQTPPDIVTLILTGAHALSLRGAPYPQAPPEPGPPTRLALA